MGFFFPPRVFYPCATFCYLPNKALVSSGLLLSEGNPKLWLKCWGVYVPMRVCLFTTCCCTWNLVPPKLFIERTSLQKGERKGSCIISGKPSFQELKDWSNTTLNNIYNANKEVVISKHGVHALTLLGPQQLLPAAEMLSRKSERGFYLQRYPLIHVSLYPPCTRTCAT